MIGKLYFMPINANNKNVDSDSMISYSAMYDNWNCDIIMTTYVHATCVHKYI